LDRVFLDANVLYSAAYLERSGLARLWTLDGVEPLSSGYAIEEARRNLAMDRAVALPRFNRLVTALSIVNAPQGLQLPKNILLDAKDQPILMSAIHGKAHYLLTGDARHFGHLYGKRIEGVMVLRPAQYFAERRRA
jgi:predicted nucleic acid-binding protein